MDVNHAERTQMSAVCMQGQMKIGVMLSVSAVRSLTPQEQSRQVKPNPAVPQTATWRKLQKSETSPVNPGFSCQTDSVRFSVLSHAVRYDAICADSDDECLVSFAHLNDVKALNDASAATRGRPDVSGMCPHICLCGSLTLLLYARSSALNVSSLITSLTPILFFLLWILF